MNRLVLITLSCWTLSCLCNSQVLWAQPSVPAKPRKIVLIAGPITGHPKHTHEYEKSVILLKHLLDTCPNLTGLTVEAVFRGWPENEAVLDDADSVVMISDGGDRNLAHHPLYVRDRLRTLEKHMQRGCGFVQLHWSTFNPVSAHDQITRWVGGYFDYESGDKPNKWFSAIKTWEGPVSLPSADHPICRGVNPFRVNEEFYYNIRFAENDRRVTPIVTTQPPGEVKSFPVGWAVERSDGGRGFGFTGGHFFRNWWNADFRKLILNAIVWSAKANVPLMGVESRLSDPFRALIVTGHNIPAHNWRATTAALMAVLEQDPRVVVDVSENVEDLGTTKIDDYDVLVLNYNNWERNGLSEQAKRHFLEYLNRGGGLAIIHFANGAFTDTLPNKESDWPEFRSRIVRRIWVHGEGKSGHDAFGQFRVNLTSEKHEITTGLQPFDTTDELYFRQEGNLPIAPLATARSRVTGSDEPMAWAYDYEKARVFQTVLGHADVSIQMAGALIRRGTVWAAGQKQISFDPPVELTVGALVRDGSPWTQELSLKGANLATKDASVPTANEKLPPSTGAVASQGRFGAALDARLGGVIIDGHKQFRSLPLTVSCWAKLVSSNRYNILVAQEVKSSATHWELFTSLGNGWLSAFLPGMKPNHVHSNFNICDGQWHHVAMVLEPKRVRLYVDGNLKSDTAVEFAGGPAVEGELAIGTLVQRELGCDGLIDDVVIAQGVNLAVGLPNAPPLSSPTTVGIWRFDELIDGERFPDSSLAKRDAVLASRRPIRDLGTKRPKITGHWGDEAVGFGWMESDSVDGRWRATELGRHFSGSIATPDQPTPKGFIVRLGDKGEASVCYDTELYRISSAWTGGFVEIHPARYGLITPQSPGGKIQFTSPLLPGWSRTPSLDDIRPHRPYGPLPRDQVRYRGFHRHSNRIVLEYLVGETRILESPWFRELEGEPVFYRMVDIGPCSHSITMLACGSSGRAVVASNDPRIQVSEGAGDTRITIAARNERIRFNVVIAPAAQVDRARLARLASGIQTEDLEQYLQGGPAQWTQSIVTNGKRAANDAAYVVDTITIPFDNPYKTLMFASGHDFFSNGDIGLCTVHGDVWRVSGIDEDLDRLEWKRMATGLFQPLGLKIVNDTVYVVGRDQITRLQDRNGDQEFDFYENFNNDGHVTMNAHEYVTCLETDSAGNFYFLKGNSEGQTAHDGSLLRVSPDGARLEVFATGFRNANGMGIGPDGTITVAPQEGEWTPGSGVFQVRQGGFYGFMPSHHRPTPPSTLEPPICWMSRIQDNSSGGQVWIPSNQWGPLSNQLLHMSYGQCRAYLVLREQVNGVWQGGSTPLPPKFDSGIMRGRFNPRDGYLYFSGLHGWVSNSITDGCLQRMRYTGQSITLPVAAKTYGNGIAVTFSSALDRQVAEDSGNYRAQQWNYIWSAKYGSPEYKVSDPTSEGRDEIDIRSATLLDDERTVFLEIDPLKPASILSTTFRIRSLAGEEIDRQLNYTIHNVPANRIPSDQLHRTENIEGVNREKLRPGLVMSLEQRTGTETHRSTLVTRLAAWAKSDAASPLRITTDGYVQVPVNATYGFDFEGVGKFRLSIDDREVFDRAVTDRAVTDRAVTGASVLSGSTSVRLRKGLHRLQVTYESPPRGAAAFRLLWKTDGVALEPIPPELLTHRPDSPELIAAGSIRQGGQLFGEQRCARCHTDPLATGDSQQERLAAGPDLERVADRISSGWLYQWLLAPHELRADATMPGLLGDPTSGRAQQEAADLTAFLTAEAAPRDARPLDERADRGRELYEGLGCIACHRFTPSGQADEYQRVSLFFAGSKFKSGELASYIQAPNRHYLWNPMPNLRCTAEEAVALEALVRRESKGKVFQSIPQGDAKRGERLFQERHCSVCHAQGAEFPVAKPLNVSISNSRAGCLAEGGLAKTTAPRFAHLNSDRDALSRFVDSAPSLASVSWDNSVARTMTRLKCSACHVQDGLMSTWRRVLEDEGELGLAPEFIPSLTWAGEKLHADWTRRLLTGEIPEKTRPWLRARMPSFERWAKSVADGLASQHGIVSQSTSSSLESGLSDGSAEQIRIGNQLTLKNNGLDCRQCHAVGQDAPVADKNSNVAPGINFAHIRDRMRYDYFRRFVLDPPRYEANTKMPKLSVDGERTPSPLLGGDAHRQFEAIWHFIQSIER